MLSDHELFENKLFQGILAVLLVLLLAGTAWRTYRSYSEPAKEFDWSNRGHSDFHNGTWTPTRAFWNGDNPYSTSVRDNYKMARAAAPFSPWIYILHAPFSWMPLPAADVAFFIYNTCLILGLAALGIAFSGTRFSIGIFLLAAVLVVMSRPGHITLFTGYFTAELAIGTAVALQYARSRPWLSGLGLLLASGKPTFIIPLFFLMACRRDFRALLYGAVFCGVAAGAGFGWLALHSSPQEVIEGIREGMSAHHGDETERPLYTWTRTDVPGMVCKALDANPSAAAYFLFFFPLAAIPGMALWRQGRSGYSFGASGLSGTIIALTILLAMYHHVYDCLILIVAWLGITLRGPKVLPQLSSPARWCVAGLLAVPAGNYFSTMMAREKLGLAQESFLWQGITVVNGVCLLAALIILLYASFRSTVYEDGSQTTGTGDEGSLNSIG